jgi:hypothetical protein
MTLERRPQEFGQHSPAEENLFFAIRSSVNGINDLTPSERSVSG